MIGVINVPPVLDSQIHAPVIATPVIAAQVAITQPAAQPMISVRFSRLQSVVSANSNIGVKSNVSAKILVKNISLWSAGVSHNLGLNLPLLAVLKAENPRSAQAAQTTLVPASKSAQATVSQLASSAQADSERGTEASGTEESTQEGAVAKEVETKGDRIKAPSLPAAGTDEKTCLSAEGLLPKAAFPNMFQVQVKGHSIAYLPTQAAAETLEQQINQLLRVPGFDPTTLRAAIVNGVPVGQAGDTVLFEITPDLAASFDRNPTLLAIAWINQLRITMGAAPIALADAQSQMYHLLPSGKQIKGNASWYDPAFEGSPTATGETFNSSDLTAAHPSLPFGTYLKVTNQQTADSVIVRVNDRGPFLSGRSLDVSSEAAHCLNSQAAGVVPFRAVIMETPPHRTASQSQPEASQASTAAP